MPENTSNVKVGDTLTVIDHPIYGVIPDGHVGDQHRVTEVVNDVHVETEPLGDADPVGTTAHVLWFAADGEAAPTRPRPTIDFSVDRYTTARDYANTHVSRVNKDETNEVLRAVANGEEVDAYALARAVADAMRHVATRFGQSMVRRRAGEQVAHLGHIAHAVIENHADGLPVYESGERSRKVEALEGEVAEMKRAVEKAQQELLRCSDHAVAETKRANEAERIAGARQDFVDQAQADLDTTSSVLDYALDLLAPEAKQRVLGYWDGLKA